MTLPAGLYYSQNKKINFGTFHNGLIGGVNCNESAAEKNLFREGLQHRRIVVAATAFYEWDQQKTKYVHLSCHLEQKPGTESREVHVDIAKPPYYNNVC